MTNDYVTTLRLMFHFVLFIESLACIFVFGKNILIEKSQANKNYLVIIKLSQVLVVIYSMWYARIELSFIYDFFNIDEDYMYEVIAMFSQSLFTGLFISSNLKKGA